MNCEICDKEIYKGKYCHDCTKEKDRLYRMNRVSNLYKNNLCTTCRKPMDRIGWVCQECVDKINNHSKMIIRDRKRNKQCVRCGKPISYSTYCQSCRDKKNAYMKERRKLARG